MIGDWVKETTTTTGTGTITLAGPATGFCSFSDLWADGFVVRYAILDANGTSRESGWGTLGGSGTTLTRDVIIETLVGGTYDASSPAAITLTTGTHTVGIAADAQAFMPAPMGRAEDTRIFAMNLTNNLGNKFLTCFADRQYGSPFMLTQTTEVSDLGLFINTGVDASTTTIGISQMVAGESLSSYIASGTISTTTTQTGTVQTTSITNVVLQPGWYMTHLVSTDAISVAATNNDNESIFSTLGMVNTTTRNVPNMTMIKNSVSVDGTLDADPSTLVSTVAANSNIKIFLVGT